MEWRRHGTCRARAVIRRRITSATYAWSFLFQVRLTGAMCTTSWGRQLRVAPSLQRTCTMGGVTDGVGGDDADVVGRHRPVVGQAHPLMGVEVWGWA